MVYWYKLKSKVNGASAESFEILFDEEAQIALELIAQPPVFVYYFHSATTGLDY